VAPIARSYSATVFAPRMIVLVVGRPSRKRRASCTIERVGDTSSSKTA
jgi:hypothetical protein